MHLLAIIVTEQSMWTRASSSQNRACGQQRHRHRTEHVEKSVIVTEQSMWTKASSSQNRACGQQRHRHRTEHEDKSVIVTEQSMLTKASSSAIYRITLINNIKQYNTDDYGNI